MQALVPCSTLRLPLRARQARRSILVLQSIKIQGTSKSPNPHRLLGLSGCIDYEKIKQNSSRCGTKTRQKRTFHHHSYPHIQIRAISSTNSPEEDKVTNREEDSTEKHPKSPTRSDKEFVDYLTSDTSSDLDSLATSTKSSQDSNEKNVDSDNEGIQGVTGDEWYNTLSKIGADLGRPTLELNDIYLQNQRTNVEKFRVGRILTVRRALAGNVVIAGSKLAAFLHSGSSAMMAEFVHSVVDCGNQSLLLIGLWDSGKMADRKHTYGYGKSIYFWALVSALGTFFLGAGVSMTQAIPELMHPSVHEITWVVWAVLGFSLTVDGYVFTKTLLEVRDQMPKGSTLWNHVWKMRDPATLAILLEDGAACLGIVMALGGIGLTQAFDMPVFDALAGVGISGLLAGMGIVLVRVNHRFLLGQAVDQDVIKGIEKILLGRRSIDQIYSVQSQWTGPETFSYKAEVDFDGTFLAAKLMPRYQEEFAEARATLDQDLRVLLSWYAEDVMRTVEREVRHIEAEVRKEYPGAEYIELEPMSKDADRYAIDDGLEASLKRIEIESLNRYLRSLYQRPSTSVNKKGKKNTNNLEEDDKKG
jgi:zinc transporter 9